ncbi:hypothetical protein KEM52_001437 [Ascosphaera acerosa]|nr:hypothetical protein KEM52_001437 [Ascosphaera acerosa]
MPQPLSSKDSANFRQVVRLCETKQNKKGLKLADQILKKNPTHGDTQAMKALILSNMGRSAEAFALCKEALRNDPNSNVCWHAYGLLWRAAKNFAEAVKAYKHALKIEPAAATVQRDLALLQAQTRDWPGYVQSRTAMLQVRPSVRANWTALAIGYHLSGDYAEAEKVLGTYEETLKIPPPRADLEHSEAVLYKNTIIAESGDLPRALEHLEKHGKRCSDRLAVLEMRADYLLRLERMPEAKRAFARLLERNPENPAYYDGYVKASGVDVADHTALKAVYDEWAERYPRNDAPRRLPLDFLTGDAFRAAADAYLTRMLQKAIPSAFANIKTLYADPAKRDTVQELVEGYAATLSPAPAHTASESLEPAKETFDSSVYFFLAQHYNHHASRDLARALAFVDKALALVPTSVEYSMTKARIHKHAGDLRAAAAAMETARQLDPKDRYVNSKAAKYALRADDHAAALALVSKFTRNDISGGPIGDFLDMQCTWFLTEDGEAYLRERRLALALKRLTQVLDIFDTWSEDQFDFHNFALRKGTVRAYVAMLRWEDRLREHPFYARAAKQLVRACLLLADEPNLRFGPEAVDPFAGLDAQERKKAERKWRKEKEEAAAAAIAAAQPTAKKGADDGDDKKTDADPLGDALVEAVAADPLAEALKHLAPVLKLRPADAEAHRLAFEVYMRQDKPVLALKCAQAAHAVDADEPRLHVLLARLLVYLAAPPAALPAPLVSLVRTQLGATMPGAGAQGEDMARWNEEYLAKHADSAAHVQAALEVRRLGDGAAAPQCEEQLVETVDAQVAQLEDAMNGLRLLDEWKSSEETRQRYVERAHRRWERATAFTAA